jgi:hypothetical protein
VQAQSGEFIVPDIPSSAIIPLSPKLALVASADGTIFEQNVAAINNALRETLINGPTAQVAGELASNFPDNEANRRSIRLVGRVNKPPYPHFSYA